MNENKASRLKIVLLTDGVSYRGSALYTFNLAEELQHSNHQVKIICAGGKLLAEIKKQKIDVQVFKAIERQSYDIFFIRRLAETIKAAKPDVLHIQKIQLAGLGASLATKTKTPYWLTAQNIHSIPKKIKLAKKYIRGIVALTEGIREHLVNETKVPKELVHLIHAGVNQRRIKEISPPSPANGQAPVIGILGPLEAWRGHEYFLKAAKEILATGRQAKFLIIGEGSLENSLRKLVAKMELRNEVIFMPDITKYYRVLPTVDIFVLPYLQMGMGLSLLEAMVCGRPVIASSVGETYHFIKENETGFLIPPKDHKAIKEKILELLDNKIMTLEIGLRARRFVEDNFSAIKMARKTGEFYLKGLES